MREYDGKGGGTGMDIAEERHEGEGVGTGGGSRGVRAAETHNECHS